MSFLGVDLGTSGLRALLVSEAGDTLGSVERRYVGAAPRPGWSEQDPRVWTEALDSAVEELRAAYPAFAGLKGIGVAGHMHGATLLDAKGEVIRPCILWNDTRASHEAAHLDHTTGLRQITGNIVFPGFTAPKLLWVKAHEPENFSRIHKVLLPAAYLNLYLTGDFVGDLSDASGTAWLETGARAWSAAALEAGDMRPDQMPRLVEGSAPAGELRADLSARWGLKHAVTVAGGAGDNAAAACGMGALAEGQGFVSLGTSGVLLMARDGYHPAPDTALHSFCHAVPGQWYQMGVMLAATDSLEWLARLTGQSATSLTSALGDTLLPPGPERFLPYISGERTPHNDADIRGTITGISAQSGPREMTRAVLEGVAFGLRDSLEAMRAAGAEPETLFAIGGGSASRYWVELIATVLGTPLALPRDGAFGAALGAARLAICAATDAAPRDVMSSPAIADTIEPNRDFASVFDAAYGAFKASYPAIKAIQ